MKRWMHGLTRSALGFALAGAHCLSSPMARAQPTTDNSPKACSNQELIKALRIIYRACHGGECRTQILEELGNAVDKPTLMGALRDPFLTPVHIFFPSGKRQLRDAIDWTTKRSHLDSLKISAANGVLFIIGRSSTRGNAAANQALSRARTLNVLSYLQDELHVKCPEIQKAWLGADYLQLNKKDARHLNIEPRDYERSTYTLNQSVEVFVFPCPASLLRAQ